MKDFRVLYRSVGDPLTGKEPGDTVSLSDTDARHFTRLGLVAEVSDTGKEEADAKSGDTTRRKSAKR